VTDNPATSMMLEKSAAELHELRGVYGQNVMSEGWANKCS
jgi:hypothetical protein